MWTRAFVAASILCASALGAQSTRLDALRPGDTLRTTAPSLGLRQNVGALRELRSDTLHLVRLPLEGKFAGPVPLAAVEMLEIARPYRSPTRTMVAGIAMGLVGAMIGGFLGSQIECRFKCDEEMEGFTGAFAGMATGFVAGGIFGGVTIGRTIRWEPVRIR